MTQNIPRHLLTGALAVAVFYGLLGVEVQCAPAEAQRLSLTLLAADLDALAREVDAIETAAAFNITLVNFLRGRGMNISAGAERLSDA